ncbi:hypothetical protein BDN67DRAFT_767878 [Paxillus ammoniavirescens]|nr:hypothetical protein BDN67DRAFT_767878 [Paxillus ammoniavirescens]
MKGWLGSVYVYTKFGHDHLVVLPAFSIALLSIFSRINPSSLLVALHWPLSFFTFEPYISHNPSTMGANLSKALGESTRDVVQTFNTCYNVWHVLTGDFLSHRRQTVR